jgi:hypothetical protein
VNGTDYLPSMAKGRALYEGAKIKSDHPEPGKEKKARSVLETVAVMKNVVVENDENGEPAVWADLHCISSHPMAPRLLEDAEKGLGAYGLSHNASSAAERFDRAAKRLVIEELAVVRSVDVVDRPATNRTLWESEPVKTTLRELYEGLTLTPKRAKWRKWLLEDDDLAPPMDAPMDAPAEGGDDPDTALWSGFKAAIMAILEGDDSAEDKAKKIAKYIKAHDKLTSDAGGDSDDEPPAESESETETEEKTEAVKENKTLKHKLAVRELCEELGVQADKTLLESAEALPIANARKLLEREKARGSGGRPRGSGFGGGAGGGKPAKKATGQSFVDAITD